VSEPSNLLIDIGNSSFKYAYFKHGSHIADLQVMRTSIESIVGLLHNVKHVWFCSVQAAQNNQQLIDICQQENIAISQVQTQSEQFGLRNAYHTPTNMGTDRWMALVAACALNDRGVDNTLIVIDAGTAITCDFVINNEHVGGWIAPGLQLARNAVVQGTKRVFDSTQTLGALNVGIDTPECLANGALAQVSGLLLQAINLMQNLLHQANKNTNKSVQIYISGGDAPLSIQNVNLPQNTFRNYSLNYVCLLYTSPSPRDRTRSRMPSSA